MVPDYAKFATENKGIFRIGSIDCDEWEAICAKEKATEFPTMKVYPPFPMPVVDIDLSKTDDLGKTLRNKAGKFISDKSIEITSNNHKTFVEEDVQTPKVLLFTNSKKGTPFTLKALSESFEKTLSFGIVREAEEGLVKQYKIKAFPSLVVVKSEGKPIKFDGKEFTYHALWEFLNVHSQVFIDPNAQENAPKVSAASKPWMTVNVPMVTKDSANDVCLKKDGALCVIMVTNDAASVSEEKLAEMKAVGESFASKISRGITFYFSYLDATAEPEFAGVFDIPTSDLPKMVVLNPGKRKRFLVHEGEIDAA
jgi:hypothetical protein